MPFGPVPIRMPARLDIQEGREPGALCASIVQKGHLPSVFEGVVHGQHMGVPLKGLIACQSCSIRERRNSSEHFRSGNRCQVIIAAAVILVGELARGRSCRACVIRIRRPEPPSGLHRNLGVSPRQSSTATLTSLCLITSPLRDLLFSRNPCHRALRLSASSAATTGG
jgi:hypothetical protein